MYKIYCYTENAQKLFNYESYVIPMIGDSYANPAGSNVNYEVTKRLLHTVPDCANVISLWLKPIN